MVAGYLLAPEHDLTVFEANNYIGGHTNTVEVPTSHAPVSIDTGFIVCNTRTYPSFLKLMDQLGVALQPSDMSFGVQNVRTGIEYNGSSLNGLFAQRTNLFRPSFWRMLRGILRFNREAPKLLGGSEDGPTLSDFLSENGYPAEFLENYLVPMGSAIWSTDNDQMLEFPARSFIQFFANHGLLQIRDHPTWLTVSGGSKRYVEKITAKFRHAIRLNSPVTQIERVSDGVWITTESGEREQFDEVILAVHSDQALKMLADPSAEEVEILGAIAYQRNEAVLHTDDSVMPTRRRAWASWNYYVPPAAVPYATVTYWMNRLQNLPGTSQYFVTLNRTDEIDPAKVLYQTTYDHPCFTREAMAAQKRWAEISGVRRTHYCGAYWSFGFHEDGVRSGLAVAKAFGKEL